MGCWYPDNKPWYDKSTQQKSKCFQVFVFWSRNACKCNIRASIFSGCTERETLLWFGGTCRVGNRAEVQLKNQIQLCEVRIVAGEANRLKQVREGNKYCQTDICCIFSLRALYATQLQAKFTSRKLHSQLHCKMQRAVKLCILNEKNVSCSCSGAHYSGLHQSPDC